jgi:hypothetical protein
MLLMLFSRKQTLNVLQYVLKEYTFVPEAPGGFIQILENMIQLSTVPYFAQLINQLA